jgi:transposase
MEKQISMPIVNPHAAGIDVGSRSHHVAVGQQADQVKEFGVYAVDYELMVSWLKDNGIRTIAMESTGSYWQALFRVLQTHGFEVLLVNGQQTKNLKGKTDVKDCRWIQKLHSLGLLSGSFLPSEKIAALRQYHRHHQFLIGQASTMTNKMQKALRLMNLRLDVVVGDIMGKSGTRIIEAILDGERNGNKLAQLADSRVRKSKAEIAAALQGNWQDELLYELKDCLETYKYYQDKIIQCDKQLQQVLSQMMPAEGAIRVSLTKKQKHKNQHGFDLISLSYRYTGVDLFAIPSVSFNTIMTFVSEVGMDVIKFKTAKQFVSWLRLAPNNKISGNKLISSRTPKSKNRLAQSLRNAANTIERQKKGPLFEFFKRIAYRKGRAAAITATARKLAVIIWNMIVRQVPYTPLTNDQYNQKIKQHTINTIVKKIKRLDLDLSQIQSALGAS